jgi:RsbT co-antagonist protein rsbRD N-terminal domain
MMLLAYRLVRLIETHSDQLVAALLQRMENSDKLGDYLSKVPGNDLRQQVRDRYQHLGQWLLGKSESDIERQYTQIGELRARQGVALSQLIWAILLVKDNLFDFLKDQAVPDRPVEVFGELEIVQLLEQFFDRAVFYAAAGYERTRAAQAAD